MLKIYYDYCCGGFGQNFRFFFIDDQEFPKIRVMMASVVVDRMRMMAFPVDVVEFGKME